MLMLREIKEKYFDLGLNDTKESDYYIVGLVIGKQIYIVYLKQLVTNFATQCFIVCLLA